MKQAFDVAVIGGGLAGLSAAALLGKAGLGAIVLERASELGGRARTTVEAGFSLNLGGHALYRNGHAWSILRELGISLEGGVPGASGALALSRTGVHALPVGLVSLLTTGLLSLGGRLSLARVLASLDGIDASAFVGMSAREWIERTVSPTDARGVLSALLRVATYTGDLERLSADVAVAQMQHVARHNVFYPDGGWQTLVHALRDSAVASGAVIAAGDGASRVRIGEGAGVVIERHDAEAIEARAVVIATGPKQAAALAQGSAAVAAYAASAAPVKVSTLDVALSRLPRPRARFALGTERPLYFSVHSLTARLAPEGGAVVHVMTYEPDGDARATEEELEGVLDRLQPGWRELVVHRRFLPKVVAMNDLVAADRGGLAGRPDVAVPDAQGVFLAGDWVGREGMLADAAMASAKRAAAAAAAVVAEGRGARARGSARGREGRGAAVVEGVT